MKRICLITTLIAGLITAVILNRLRLKQTNAQYTIGILQTAAHPALDAVREGFEQELQRELGNNVAFKIYNAQGSIVQAHAIAQQLHADKSTNAFFAIATPAAIAISALEKEKPIMIAAVTDPHALGLIHPTSNICGTQDMIDIAGEIEMLIHLVPHAKTVGLLFTSGEANSIVAANLMRAELEKHGITSIDFAVSNEADMPTAVETACRKVDALLAPTDNTVASCITLIASITEKKHIPLIVSDNMLVASGALASRGIDYNEHGKHAARIAQQVLVENKKPFELPVEHEKTGTVFINRDTLHALELSIPNILEKHVVLITQGQ